MMNFPISGGTRTSLDEATPVREGEQLDLEKLETYLLAHIPGAQGPLEIAQFPGGHSNLTYLLKLGETELVLRRPPFGNKVKSAHDMGREYRVLSALHGVYGPAPKPYVYCQDASIIGCEFFAMQRIRGVILRRNIPDDLDADEKTVRRLCESFIDNLVDLHGIDYQACGLGDLGRPEGFIRRQIEGWARRYERCATEDIPEMSAVIRWLMDHMPPEAGACIIHNDYKYDNTILDPEDMTRILAVLDWEMCTTGDPLMDLGVTLGYWVEAQDPEPFQRAAWGPTFVPGSMNRKELAERYCGRMGLDASKLLYYYCWALFKTSVVIQQIYYRYEKGHTRDARFANLHHMVRILIAAAARAIRTGRYSNA